MKQIVTKGIILARTDFGEADRILTILTQDYGKIRAIAKGVRKVKSKLAGGIELFSVSHITFIQGKGDINTLTSIRLETHYSNIVTDINRTMLAYEFLKQINRLTEDNTETEYFELLQTTLEALDDLEIDQAIIQFWLNLQLLKLAGHTPNLRTDADQKILAEDQKYNFDFDKMSFTVNSNGVYQAGHIKLLRLGLNIESPLQLKQVAGLDKVLDKCLNLTKTIFNRFINQ